VAELEPVTGGHVQPGELCGAARLLDLIATPPQFGGHLSTATPNAVTSWLVLNKPTSSVARSIMPCHTGTRVPGLRFGQQRSHALLSVANHFYFYCLDADFGPFFVKFCSYFPYNAKLCLNGQPDESWSNDQNLWMAPRLGDV